MPNPPASLDGLTPAQSPKDSKQNESASEESLVKKWKFFLLTGAGILYLIFVMWCVFLLSVLPSTSDLSGLVMIGIIGCIIGALLFIGAGVFIFLHISQIKATPKAKQFALIKLIAAIVPGLILAGVTPLVIIGEPALAIDITAPLSAEELVAPLSMTFDVSNTVAILADRDFRTMQYRWDINGDRTVDQETLEPTITATFDRQGIYTVSVQLIAQDGSTRSASKKFVIRQAVFSVTPSPPIIDKPTVFSVAHLFPDPKAVASIAWDFDKDGKNDEETTDLQTSYTFLRTGKVTVKAVVQLTNKTQVAYQRIVDVQEPPPLPFPVDIVTQPRYLIGTPPFPALFTVESLEPLYSVQWDFGDGQKAEGERVTHTFAARGTFAVQARVRSQSGTIATISTVVKVVDKLSLADLKFEGTPEVRSNRISGEVPLSLDLRAVTQQPFVTFTWEAPDATELGSTDDHLQAIYRRPGTYTITLVGQDMENHVLRQPITVEVLPASSLISIQMEPETGVAPLTVKFDASASSIPGDDITGFIWSFGDNTSSEVGGAVTQHTYSSPGTYVINLIARTSTGKQQSAVRTIVVRAPSIQARILASRLSGNVPLTVAFDASGSTGTVETYLWDFGDGSQNDSARVEHTFTSPGEYTVRLEVRDASGRTSESTITITVLP